MMVKQITRHESTSIALKTKPSDRKIPPKHWSNVLIAAVDNCALHVYSDDRVVVIEDRYPKAHHHWLVIARKADLNSILDLSRDHVTLLEHMLHVGQEIAHRSSRNEDVIGFRYGFHSIPSVRRLHMHIISNDFVSLHLKTKKHWNSFTSDFFIHAKDAIDELRDRGRILVDRALNQQRLKQALRCTRCDEQFATIPLLKRHLQHEMDSMMGSDQH